MVDILMKNSQRNAKNRRNRYQKRCPFEIGNEYEVNITETTPNGSGIARIKSYLILVDNTKPGDHKTVMITKTGPLSAEAKIVK